MKNQKLGFLSSLLSKWQSEATLIGKSVLPVFLVIRLVTLGAAGQAVWLNDDDEAGFICETRQPGCVVVCLSEAVPLSPARLWTLQLLLVLAPGLVFLCYLIHLTNQEHQVRTGDGEVKGHARGAYLACVASVILVEVGFVVAQSSLYASCLSILLSVVEGVCVLLRAKQWHRQPDGENVLHSGSEVKESWCFLSRLLVLWHSHASFLGKTILPVLQLIRLIIVGGAVQPVWYNDLGHFICDPHEPGCTQEAFNNIFPFSLHRYWTLQVVLVLTPGLIFFCYLVHLIIMEKKNGPGTWDKAHVLWVYLGYLSTVVLLEVGFAAGQALVFGFSQSNVVSATRQCSHMVDCFVPKAKEKTVFMVIMFSVACLSGLLTLMEMGIVLKRERPCEKCQSSETSGFQMRSKVKEEVDTTEDNEGCTKLNI